MNDSGNLVFVALAVLILGLGFMAFSGNSPSKSEPVAMPYVNPVILNDGRSACEKKADIYFIRSWNKTCLDSKQEPTCDLYPEAIKPLSVSRNIVLGNCLRPLI